MLNIAVVIYDLTVEYNYTVVKGIVDFFKDKNNVRLLIAAVNVPNAKTDFYDYQYWTSTEILKSKDIDGYIIVPNSFGNHIDWETIQKKFALFTEKPVVSVGVPLKGIKNNKYTYISSVNSYCVIVEHLIKKHNRTKIAFFSSSLIDSVEGEERLEAYKMALKKNGLEFNPDFILPGDYTPGTASEYLLKTYKTKEEVPFDAIICANDYTAGGCLIAFEKLGIKCPEDIALFGFDDSYFSTCTFPTLSTVNQFVSQSGFLSGELIYNILSGVPVPEKIRIDNYPVYRQSCGCIDSSVQSSAYYDEKGVYHGLNEDAQKKLIEESLREHDNLKSIYQLMNMMDSYYKVDRVKTILLPILTLTKVSIFSLCLYDEPVELEQDEDFTLPEKAVLTTFVNLEKNEKDYLFDLEKTSVFNPRESLLPSEIKNEEPGTYFLLPVFLRTKNYGYMMCKFNTTNYTLISIYSKIISNSIIQSYEYSKTVNQKEMLMEKNQNLSIQSMTDELTQIFNRRGFTKYGEQLLELSISTGKTGFVFFCDIDGLKTINDTYGHEIGDIAIKTQAKVLTSAFRDSDLIGRLSGDEFGVIAPGFKPSRINELHERIQGVSEVLSKEAGLPFILSISFGYEVFSEENSSLHELLMAADKRLYEEKIIKHGKKQK